MGDVVLTPRRPFIITSFMVQARFHGSSAGSFRLNRANDHDAAGTVSTLLRERR